MEVKMSADNGIYIHKFRKGYKVVHTQAIDNIYWKRGRNRYNYKILKEVFKGSPVFKTRGRAFNYAVKLSKDICYIEYGICEV